MIIIPQTTDGEESCWKNGEMYSLIDPSCLCTLCALASLATLSFHVSTRWHENSPPSLSNRNHSSSPEQQRCLSLSSSPALPLPNMLTHSRAPGSKPVGTWERPLRTFGKTRTIVQEPIADAPAADEAPPIAEGEIFNCGRPGSLKSTSNRKATGAKKANPYNRSYLVKNLGLTVERWDIIYAHVVSIVEKNMDLIVMDFYQQQYCFSTRLNGIGLLEGILELLPVELKNDGRRGFLCTLSLCWRGAR